ALVCEPAAAGDRAGDRHRPADPAPRRAGCRDEPGGDARDHGSDREAPHRGRLHDPADRARHARGRGHLRPSGRARPRREERGGVVRGGRDGSEGRRGVPRPRRYGAEMSTNGAPLLRLEEINTYYGLIHILQDVNIEVREGELVCLLGGNASGKSTTLKTI